MKPGPIPLVVNFAQTSESQELKKVLALKKSERHNFYEGEGEI